MGKEWPGKENETALVDTTLHPDIVPVGYHDFSYVSCGYNFASGYLDAGKRARESLWFDEFFDENKHLCHTENVVPQANRPNTSVIIEVIEA